MALTGLPPLKGGVAQPRPQDAPRSSGQRGLAAGLTKRIAGPPARSARVERRRRQGGGALGRRAGSLSSAPPTRLPARSGEGSRRAARGREATGGPAPARPRRSPPFGPVNCARRAFLFRPSHSPRRRLAPPRARRGPAVCDVGRPRPRL